MKIGNYQIPTFRLYPKVEEAVRLIYENYKLEEAKDSNSVAVLCGHKSANSGGWLYKLADMRAYGLIEKRGIKITPLAEKFLAGTDDEKQKATNDVILNIPLWKELYSKSKSELPESNFWVQLQNITNVPNIEAQKYADSVRKAYLEDISHYKLETEVEKMDSESLKGTFNISDTTNMGRTAQADIVRGLVMQGAYDIAKQFIDFIANKSKEEKPNTTT